MKKFHILLLPVLLVVLVACGNNNQTSADAAAAQQLLPNIVGYTASDVDSIVDALTKAGAGGALASGNVPAAAAVARAEVVIQCLQDKGVVGGKSYLQQVATDLIPQAGVAVVINQSRLNENLLGCLLTGGNTGFSAQAVTIEPCAMSGSFSFQNNSYAYIYVGVGDEICGYFAQHFTSLSATP
jgi:hypothetical protein